MSAASDDLRASTRWKFTSGVLEPQRAARRESVSSGSPSAVAQRARAHGGLEDALAAGLADAQAVVERRVRARRAARRRGRRDSIQLAADRAAARSSTGHSSGSSTSSSISGTLRSRALQRAAEAARRSSRPGGSCRAGSTTAPPATAAGSPSVPVRARRRSSQPADSKHEAGRDEAGVHAVLGGDREADVEARRMCLRRPAGGRRRSRARRRRPRSSAPAARASGRRRRAPSRRARWR